MGAEQINENNREFLLEMMKKLQLDKKLKEEGKVEGKVEGKMEGERQKAIAIAKNLLQMGMDILTVVKATGLSEKETKEIKEAMH